MTESIKKHLEDRDYGSPGFVAAGFSTWFREYVGIKNLVLAIGFVLSVTVFYGLVVYIKSGAMPASDQPLLLYLHRYATPWLDEIAQAVSVMVTVISVAILGYLLYRRAWRQAGFWLLATAGAAILAGIVKRAVHRHRPDLWDLVSLQGSFSFPSGHAMQSMAIVIALLILFYSPRTRSILLTIGGAFVIVVALCRMYLGLHYPSDILAGWSLAAAWVCMIGILFGHFDKTSKHARAD